MQMGRLSDIKAKHTRKTMQKHIWNQYTYKHSDMCLFVQADIKEGQTDNAAKWKMR